MCFGNNQWLFTCISKNKIIGRKYTTKITPRVDTLLIPEPYKRKVYAGIESSFNQADFVRSIGVGLLINPTPNQVYQLGIGVNNTTADGTNGKFSPYIKGGVYWKIKIKK